MDTLRIAIGQVNATVGDLEGNARKIQQGMEKARELGAHLVVFPEMCLTGYPPEDLLLRTKFVSENLRWLDECAKQSRGLTAVVGFIDRDGDIFNAAAVLHDGEVAGIYHKMLLPNYGVFDEQRYFRAGEEPLVFTCRGVRVGLTICEDIWHPEGPTKAQVLDGGAEVLINISGSPYHMDKVAGRDRMLCTRAADHIAVLVYVNLVGGQDELIFDGNSRVIDERGEVVATGKAFEEDFFAVDIDAGRVFNRRLRDLRWRRRPHVGERGPAVRLLGLPDPVREESGPSASLSCAGAVAVVGVGVGVGGAVGIGAAAGVVGVGATVGGQAPEGFIGDRPVAGDGAAHDAAAAEVYAALRLGLRDYVHKNGFRRVVLGLSGGIDSALTATLAVDALGPENVVGVAMPSEFSSEGSLLDAKELAANLGIEYHVIPISEPFESYRRSLLELFAGTPFNVAEENLQARVRGNLLMALSNKFGWLLLATGNKSEMSTGYGTLYGDMAGGFAPIKDVPKLLVYRLAHYRNQVAERPLIPSGSLEKPPSAELRPDQKDVDSLPPYEQLDPILHAIIESDLDVDSIVALGYPADVVRRVAHLVAQSEHKRRQAPPGLKVTPRAFGRDRRYPVTNRYRER